MRINVVCTDVGWIYSKFVEMFRKHSKHEILLNSKEECDVTHYLPYYEVPKSPVKPCTSWQSHMEGNDPLKAKFIQAARAVDVPISHSKKYAELLKAEGIQNAKQIIPGVDAELFERRSTVRSPNDKLVVGYIGRHYSSSNRKNPTLLDEISKLPFVDFRTTGGNIKDEDIPKFYADLDIVVSPATIEGGPMAIQEALATGTPIICFVDVGVTQEFSTGVIKVSPDDKKDTFLSRLETIWRSKSYTQYRHAGIMNQMRYQVMHYTWERFVKRHDMVWESLV